MSQFAFQALDEQGRMQHGVLEASDERALAASLKAKGWTPLKIGPDSGASRRTLSFGKRTERLSLETQVTLLGQLAVLLRAGLPLDRALGSLEASGGRPDEARLIDALREGVRRGQTLSDAVIAQGNRLPPIVPAMIKAGEAGGQLPLALQRLSEHMGRASAFRRSVVNALIYPAILLAAVLLSLGFLMGYVVPQFGEMYANLGAELPWFSKIILQIGLALRKGWWLIFALVLVALLIINALMKRPGARLQLDRALLQRAWLGTLLANIQTERYLRALSTLLSSGVSLLQAMAIARGVLSNAVFESAVLEAESAVRGGSRLSDALAHAPNFPRLPLQMARIGEESGEIAAMLQQGADTLALDVQTRLERVLAALVPVVTVLMFVLIAAVVMAILVPLYDLTSVIG